MAKVFGISSLPTSKLFRCFEPVFVFNRTVSTFKVKHPVLKDEFVSYLVIKSKPAQKPKIRNYIKQI